MLCTLNGLITLFIWNGNRDLNISAQVKFVVLRKVPISIKSTRKGPMSTLTLPSRGTYDFIK